MLSHYLLSHIFFLFFCCIYYILIFPFINKITSQKKIEPESIMNHERQSSDIFVSFSGWLKLLTKFRFWSKFRPLTKNCDIRQIFDFGQNFHFNEHFYFNENFYFWTTIVEQIRIIYYHTFFAFFELFFLVQIPDWVRARQ